MISHFNENGGGVNSRKNAVAATRKSKTRLVSRRSRKRNLRNNSKPLRRRRKKRLQRPPASRISFKRFQHQQKKRKKMVKIKFVQLKLHMAMMTELVVRSRKEQKAQLHLLRKAKTRRRRRPRSLELRSQQTLSAARQIHHRQVSQWSHHRIFQFCRTFREPQSCFRWATTNSTSWATFTRFSRAQRVLRVPHRRSHL